MNFEFKSTFKQIRKTIEARPVRYYALRLLANAASVGAVTALYLSNHLLPAVIISRPFGLLYFALAMAAIAFKMAVGATHTIALLIKCYAPTREWTANQLIKRNAEIRLSQRYLYWVANRSTINQTQKL